MSASTMLPPKEGISSALARATSAEGLQSQARLIGPDGTETALPPEVYIALSKLVQMMGSGQAVTIAVSESAMTTQEAADFLGVSRPTLVKLLDSGALSFTRPGRHRRLQFKDVAAYREQRRTIRLKALDDLAEISQSMGLYDDEDEAPIRR
jgi:excisionase family DNA binding protein